MPKSRLANLRLACLALMAARLVLGLVVLATMAIPLRRTDHVTATVAFLLAAITFVLAGVGVAWAALNPRT